MQSYAYRYKKEQQIHQYVLEEKLGRGGFAEVWKARDTTHARRIYVALKLFDETHSRWQEIRRRAQREVDTLAHVVDDRIVPIRHFNLVDPNPFMAMALMDGGTLAARITRGEGVTIAPAPKTASPDQIICARFLAAAPIFSQLIDALEVTHKFGLVHRDVKPSNILFEAPMTSHPMGAVHGKLRLADFGIVYLTEELRQNAEGDNLYTEHGFQLGTPGYMAPEQIQPETARDPDTEQIRPIPITKAADIYSAGVVLYEMITGCRPIEGTDVTAIMVAWKIGAVIPLSTRIPESLHPRFSGIIEVVDCCLERSPGDRFQNCTALRKAFNRAMVQFESGPPGPPGPPGPGPSGQDDGSGQKDKGNDRKTTMPMPPVEPQRWQRWGLLFLAVLTLVGVGYAMMHEPDPKQQPPPSPPSPCAGIVWNKVQAGDPMLSSCSNPEAVARLRQIQQWQAVTNWATRKYDDKDLPECAAAGIPACQKRFDHVRTVVTAKKWAPGTDCAGFPDCLNFPPRQNNDEPIVPPENNGCSTPRGPDDPPSTIVQSDCQPANSTSGGKRR